MKKLFFSIFILLVLIIIISVQLFTRKQIGETHGRQVIQIGVIDKVVPVYSYFDEISRDFYVVEGEKKLGPYTSQPDLKFSPDGKTFAYAVRINDQWCVIINGDQVYSYESARGIVFLSDGTLAYLARIDGEEYMIIGDKKDGPYDLIFDSELFSSGPVLVYRAKIGKKFYLTIGDKKFGPYDDTYLSYPRFSPDGTTYAYTAKLDDRHYIFKEEEMFGPYNGTGYFNFSLDSKSFSYTAEINGKNYVFVGNEKLRPYDSVRWLEYSSSGNLAFETSTAGYSYVVDGEQIYGPYDWTSGVQFSPDGRTIAYVAKINDNDYVIVNDKKAISTIFFQLL